MTDQTDQELPPVSLMKQILNVIGMFAAAAWVVMFLYVGTAMAEHANTPHAGSASKDALGIVRINIAGNTQSIIANERFAAAMRNQNTIDHAALNDLVVAQALVINQIWDKIK